MRPWAAAVVVSGLVCSSRSSLHFGLTDPLREGRAPVRRTGEGRQLLEFKLLGSEERSRVHRSLGVGNPTSHYWLVAWKSCKKRQKLICFRFIDSDWTFEQLSATPQIFQLQRCK